MAVPAGGRGQAARRPIGRQGIGAICGGATTRWRCAPFYPPAVTDGFEIPVGGERVVLLPERAAWWARRETLILADLHLGKSQTLRAAGAAIPSGVLDETLGRLDRAIERTGATRLLVVGDLLHAGVGLTADLVERVGRWRALFPGRLTVVPGNHDRSLASVAERWGAEIAEGVLKEDGLAFTHEPAAQPGLFTWAGHVHPAIRLSGGGDRVRLPCFVIGSELGLLPAFTRFAAGGGSGSFAPGARVLAIAEDRIIEVR